MQEQYLAFIGKVFETDIRRMKMQTVLPASSHDVTNIPMLVHRVKTLTNSFPPGQSYVQEIRHPDVITMVSIDE